MYPPSPYMYLFFILKNSRTEKNHRWLFIFPYMGENVRLNRLRWAQLVADELGVSRRFLAIQWALFTVQMGYISYVVRSPLWFLRLEHRTDGSNHFLLAPQWPEICCWVLDLVLLAIWCFQSLFSVTDILYVEWYLELRKQHLIFKISYSAVWKDFDKFYLPPTPLSLSFTTLYFVKALHSVLVEEKRMGLKWV